MVGNHLQALLLAVCCCDEENNGCSFACGYVAVDGAWVFLPNAPAPECNSTGLCVCLEPNIVPECEGQVAACICHRIADGDPPTETPPCGYTTCFPT